MSKDNGTGTISPEIGRRGIRTFRYSESQLRAITRLRKWKRNRVKWGAQPCFSGRRYLDLLRDGRARPYDLSAIRHELREALSSRAIELLEHVIACERGFGKHAGGVQLEHATTAQILGCSPRTAQDVVHELVAVGLLQQRPRFRLLSHDERVASRHPFLAGVCRKHQELAPRYVTTSVASTLVDWARRNQASKNRQPGGSQRLLRRHSKGVRCRGRAFVASLLEPTIITRQRPEVARVIERLPDGRIALGSPLTAAAVAERLRREGAADRRGSVDDDPLARCWATFEARAGGRT